MPRLWADSLDEHRALVLGRLVDAYVALVVEGGVEELTVSAVAQRAALARSAVYNHVDHLHDLALLHVEETLVAWLQPLEQRAAAGASAWDRLEDLVRSSLTVFAEDPLAALDLASHLDETRATRLAELLRPIRAHLQRTVADGVANGEFINHDPVALGGFAWACIAGYRTLVGDGRLAPGEAADTLVPLLARAVLAAPPGTT